MKRYLLICFYILVSISMGFAQQNLALTSTASASGGSTGLSGPHNWVDRIFNGSHLAWVGTTPSFPFPIWIELAWLTPQTFNRLRLHNPGTIFIPHGVNFNGMAQLDAWNSIALRWDSIANIQGSGAHGFYHDIIFQDVTTTKIRITKIRVNGAANQNPGFDEIEVFNDPFPCPDLQFSYLSSSLNATDANIQFSVKILEIRYLQPHLIDGGFLAVRMLC